MAENEHTRGVDPDRSGRVWLAAVLVVDALRALDRGVANHELVAALDRAVDEVRALPPGELTEALSRVLTEIDRCRLDDVPDTPQLHAALCAAMGVIATEAAREQARTSGGLPLVPGVPSPGVSDEPGRQRLLTVAVHQVGDAVVLAAAGEIDVVTITCFRTALDQVIDQAGTGPIVIDLSHVPFLASAGLTAVVQAAALARPEHLPLRLVVDPARPAVCPAEIADLDDVLWLYPTVAEALS